MRVDESTVILGPIDHVGWARASAMVTSASSARVRPRNGPPLAVRTMRASRSTLPVGADGVGPQALVDGAVLGVDGDDLGPRRAPGHRHHRPAGDEGLLVGQGQPVPGPQGGQGDGEPGEAHHSVDHHVGVAGDGGQRTRSGVDLDLHAGREGLPQGRRPVGVGDGDHVGPELGHLGGQLLDRGGGAQGHDAVPVGLSPHHVEGLPADGAGRADQAHRLHRNQETNRTSAK